MRYVWLGLVLAASCSGGDDEGRAPAAPDTQGGSSSTGGKKSPPLPGPSDGGAGGEAANAGGRYAGGEGGGIVYEEDDPPMFEPGVCDPAMDPGADEAVTLPGSNVQLLAMTADELSVAYLAGEPPVLFVADRSATNQAFSELEVTLPEGFEASSGVSLSSDGTRLILVKQDHTGFGELVRNERGVTFAAEVDEARFAFLNTLPLTNGRKMSWPVVASDGQTLYYVTSPGHSLVVQSSADDEGVFRTYPDIDMYTLGGPEGEYKFLTGISSDERAIFFDDEATGHAMALFRQYEDAPFYDLLDLGERAGVAPNLDCTRLYSSAGGGLVVQSLE